VRSGAGQLTRPVRTGEAKDRHETRAIAQRLYPDSTLAVVCNGDWARLATMEPQDHQASPLPSAHAKWIELKTSPMRGSEQPIVRRMLRQNAIEEWTPMQKTGWKRCQPGW